MRTPHGRRGLRHGAVATLMARDFFREVYLDLVVDVGANRGQFLIDVRDAFPRAAVIAFEPLEAEFATLNKIHGNDAQIDLRMLALGAHQGTVDFHVSAAADSSSLLPIGSSQVLAFPGTHESRVATVELSRLDAQLSATEIPTRSLLKLDVQGGELVVLKGSIGVLDRFAYVLAELSFVELYQGQPLAHEVFSFLGDFGFVLDRVLSLTVVSGRSVQSDFVFRNCRLTDA